MVGEWQRATRDLTLIATGLWWYLGAMTHAPSKVGPLFSVSGRCPICETEVLFNAWSEHYRDSYLCGRCGSIPRERALMVAIERHYPNWRTLRIHESSPADRGVSAKLKAECQHYTATQFSPSVPLGTYSSDGWLCENIENQTFGRDSFDLVITQDVFEHIFNPEAAFREIARTLADGGAHIWTTPLVFGKKPTVRCASIDADGKVTHLQPPDYHKNPIDPEGSLVTFWYGYDLAELTDRSAPFTTSIVDSTCPDFGIIGPLTEVLVSIKKSARSP